MSKNRKKYVSNPKPLDIDSPLYVNTKTYELQNYGEVKIPLRDAPLRPPPLPPKSPKIPMRGEPTGTSTPKPLLMKVRANQDQVDHSVSQFNSCSSESEIKVGRFNRVNLGASGLVDNLICEVFQHPNFFIISTLSKTNEVGKLT